MQTMKYLNLFFLLLLIVLTGCAGNIKNAKSENVHIYGNCGMCKKTIEKAGNQSGIAIVEWDKETKKALLTFDSSKSTKSEILKRIALAGYDNELYAAPDDVYSALPNCCQYERKAKIAIVNDDMTKDSVIVNADKNLIDSIAIADKNIKNKEMQGIPISNLNGVYEAYFALKDALVVGDVNLVAKRAKFLNQTITDFPMGSLTSSDHMIWMKYKDALIKSSSIIALGKKIESQREKFEFLSDNLFAIMKVIKPSMTVYQQHCPMYHDGKGADWISKESAIKNPYYGSMMLSCGSVKETIK